MYEADYIIACLMIPVAYVLMYIAGRYDILRLVCKMLNDWLEETEKTDKVSVVRCQDCVWYKESEELAPIQFCYRLTDKDGKRVGHKFDDEDFCSRGTRKVKKYE